MDVFMYEFPCESELQNCLKLDEKSKRAQGMPQRIMEFLLDFCIQKVKSRSAPAKIKCSSAVGTIFQAIELCSLHK